MTSPVLCSLGAIAVLLFLILLVMLFTQQIYPIPVSSNNVGNLLLQYFAAVAIAVRSQQCVHVFWVITRPRLKLCPLLQSLPTHIYPQDIDLPDETRHHLRACNLGLSSLSAWEGFSLFLHFMQPYMSQLLRTKLEPLGRKRDRDIVIHFRCSDTPFNRHPSYTFLRFAYYSHVVEFLCEPGDRVIIVTCASHRSRREYASACLTYLSELCRYLRECLTHVEVASQCMSVECDLATMVFAKRLIVSDSSFATVAALARTELSVLPAPRRKKHLNGMLYTNMIYLDSSEMRLDHEDVPDYLDLPSVIAQLRHPLPSSVVNRMHDTLRLHPHVAHGGLLDMPDSSAR